MALDADGNEIAEEELVLDAPEPDEDTALDPEPEPDNAEPQGEWLDENRFKFADGTIVDPDGNEIDDEPEPEAVAKPAERKPEAAAQRATEISADGTTIYRVDLLEKAIYTEERVNEIADLMISEPQEAMRKQRDLDRQFREQEKRLVHHASSVFEQRLDAYAQQAPQAVERYARQINQEKEQLTPEQQQHPDAVTYVVTKVIAAQLAADPLAAEEFAMRSLPQTRANTGGGAPGARTAARPAPTRKAPEVITPALRNVGPGSARRPDPSRRPSGAQPNRDPLVATFQKMYGLSIDEAKARADEMRAQQAQRGVR